MIEPMLQALTMTSAGLAHWMAQPQRAVNAHEAQRVVDQAHVRLEHPGPQQEHRNLRRHDRQVVGRAQKAPPRDRWLSRMATTSARTSTSGTRKPT